ncbi:MAG: UvrD-helicase domain-containing protein [Deltaproteobacteria bacterium]|nr:UvrD-helicase domain-containing protein [Deltaproteobacteria bacterium]
MKFIADLHIHSRFSRATAKNLDFERLYISAANKGITVVGTGDFTHPGWLAEIREKLVSAEPGLFKLNDETAAGCKHEIHAASLCPVRFMLSCEISSIYKKNDATRKLHNLVFMPDIAAAERFNARLSDIGNLKSDGRPILGLDSKNLLEIVLETDDRAFLVPAHIWTPWFSMFGSKSGFDSIEECFDDLSSHIFAVETGLSSDPAMNWRVGNLDGITLISNSDAHSPANLGREANLLNTALSYDAIRSAMETGDPEKFLGTLEFYPQEGKYHQDGHRKCGINLHPRQTMENKGICPVCGKALTLGVCYRVEELATRPEGEKPEKTHPYYSIVPLAEIISEIVKTGPKSKRVGRALEAAVKSLGPELHILHIMPVEEIRSAGMPVLAEAVSRMRAGVVNVTPGFDGEYGCVRLFNDGEIDAFAGQKSIFPGFSKATKKNAVPKKTPIAPDLPVQQAPSVQMELFTEPRPEPVNGADAPGLDPAQHRAVFHQKGPLLIVAGPGSGKTHTLTRRIERLITEEKTAASGMLAVTFTHKAAGEMAERLAKMLGPGVVLPQIATFHSFSLSLLKETGAYAGYAIADEIDRMALVAEAMESARKAGITVTADTDAMADLIASAKQAMLAPDDDLSGISKEASPNALSAAYGAYAGLLGAERLFDFEDLVFFAVKLISDGRVGDKDIPDRFKHKFSHVFIDEYQDINYAQYRLVRALCAFGAEVCAIGDPDQSIYGFRGSDPSYFTRFHTDWPGTKKVFLKKCFRSTPAILSAAGQALGSHRLSDAPETLYSEVSGPEHVFSLRAETGKSEAVAMGRIMEDLVGGLGFHYHDQGRDKGACPARERAFSDFAVLFRTKAQGEIIAEVFGKAGIPFLLASSAHTLGQKQARGIIAALRIIEAAAAPMDIVSIAGAFLPHMTRRDIRGIKKIFAETGISLSRMQQVMGNDLEIELSPAGLSEFLSFMMSLTTLFPDTAGMRVEKKILRLCETLLQTEKDQWGVAQRDAIEALLSMARGYGDDANAFLDALALKTDSDFYDRSAQRVALMTLHASKGLEFPVVFIAGCEDGYLPLRRSNGLVSDINEERRLFYVGMTRAKERLYLCSAKKRKIFGSYEQRAVSPFMESIDRALIHEAGESGFRRRRRQLTLFS